MVGGFLRFSGDDLSRRLPRLRIGLKDRKGVAFGILADGKPADAGQGNFTYYHLSAGVFDQVGIILHCRDLDADADLLARVLAAGQAAVDAVWFAVAGSDVPVRFTTFWCVVLPTPFKS